MTTLLDMDSILDQTLDNVEDVPDYVTPPAGLYVLKINDAKIESYKNKKGEEGLRIKLVESIVATEDCGDEVPPAAGSLFSETFQATEDGLKFFKKQAKRILNVEDISGVSIRDILDSLKNVEYRAKVTIKRTPNKDGGDPYENIQVRPIHGDSE